MNWRYIWFHYCPKCGAEGVYEEEMASDLILGPKWLCPQCTCTYRIQMGGRVEASVNTEELEEEQS